MRECAFCGLECDSQIGFAREIHTTYFGGRRTGVVHGPRIVSFFCNEEHRSNFEAAGMVGGELQTERWVQDFDRD